jgi:hypothetical protein
MKNLAGVLFVVVLLVSAAVIAAEGSVKTSACAPKATNMTVAAAWPSGPGYTGSACAFNWADISMSGTELQLGDDAFDGPFGLGFDFRFYGEVYSEVFVSSNGFISFGAGSGSTGNPCPMSADFGTPYVIAPAWDDLDPGDTQDPIYYQAFDPCPIGSGRCFIAQWDDICRYPGGPECAPGGTFQVIVYEDNTIVIQIEDAGQSEGESSSTGIVGNDDASDHALTYACNEQASISDQLCVQIDPVFGLYTYVAGGIAHVQGSQGTSWRTSFAATNTSGQNTDLEFAFIEGSTETTANSWLADGDIAEWDDVTMSLFGFGWDAAGSIKVTSDAKLTITARTYNQSDDGTFGQYLPGLAAGTGLPPGFLGILSHLKGNADYRTNIGFVNLGDVQCELRYQLFNIYGAPIGGMKYVTIGPYRWKQENRVFQGLGQQDIAYATVELVNGDCRAWAYASVVDENSGDPTTIPVSWEK